MITQAKYEKNGTITAIVDGQEISNITESNWRYSQIQEWVNEGNTIEPYVEPVIVLTNDDVNTERDYRIENNFHFNGEKYDFDPIAKSRITGAATLAGFALGAGAQADNLRWHGGTTDFTWITYDNSLVTMDAQTCFMFGKAAATHETAHIFSAKIIKGLDPIPEDYKDDKYWPTV